MSHHDQTTNQPPQCLCWRGVWTTSRDCPLHVIGMHKAPHVQVHVPKGELDRKRQQKEQQHFAYLNKGREVMPFGCSGQSKCSRHAWLLIPE